MEKNDMSLERCEEIMEEERESVGGGDSKQIK